ncbi:TetR/AcrR family transcriptional regulator C-terminal domain-containing protein [Oceanobacillus jeddahense]|uniref:TetR/AcrR family transcriptional regulator C-terminal domain-containing protein n=1 Tax=Oceanobacillus jeddahense TaxID=1462527 RepID=A0ABY5JLE8_9BACI|nr:TetR/AcrR family transcriptional regulator C-terminal domain-containing protein [Oceanobacillus jeddahense]UUI01127.1 TetR/AcrR family transcriptional regulator C-terminal domain-containing protein [Oceanobacillus jeddahense]
MALKKQQIIKEALELLNESGLEGVTLRKLASRLDVQAPALYWHFKNKHVLVNEMAETILQTEFHDLTGRKNDEPWQDWLLKLFHRLRKALLSYTDGGRVVAGAHLSLTMADVSELAIRTLVNAGLNLQQSRLIVLTATRFTFGHVIEEQTNITQKEMQDFHVESFNQAHPTLAAGIEEYFSAGKTIDDLFNDGLQMIIR